MEADCSQVQRSTAHHLDFPPRQPSSPPHPISGLPTIGQPLPPPNVSLPNGFDNIPVETHQPNQDIIQEYAGEELRLQDEIDRLQKELKAATIELPEKDRTIESFWQRLEDESSKLREVSSVSESNYNSAVSLRGEIASSQTQLARMKDEIIHQKATHQAQLDALTSQMKMEEQIRRSEHEDALLHANTKIKELEDQMTSSATDQTVSTESVTSIVVSEVRSTIPEAVVSEVKSTMNEIWEGKMESLQSKHTIAMQEMQLRHHEALDKLRERHQTIVDGMLREYRKVSQQVCTLMEMYSATIRRFDRTMGEYNRVSERTNVQTSWVVSHLGRHKGLMAQNSESFSFDPEFEASLNEFKALDKRVQTDIDSF